MSSPDRPKRPSARSTTRPDPRPVPDDSQAPGTLLSGTTSAGGSAPASVQVPKSSAPRAPRVSARHAKPSESAPSSGSTPAVAPPAPVSAHRGAKLSQGAKSKPPAVTERPAKSRPSRAAKTETISPAEPLRPGIEAFEAEDAWNAEPAPAIAAFDRADSQQGLTREIEAARLLRAGQPDAAHQYAERNAAQSILATDYYARQYGAHGLRSLAADVDEFGFDPYVEEQARGPLEALVRRYFRVDLDGADRIPSEGRALFVANRAGILPWDALVLRTVVRMQRPDLPPLRWLAEDDVIHYPFLGVLLNRLGAVRACPENAERLLRRDRLVAVFPEGAQGSSKNFDERYRLQRFGRGGYVRLALKLGTPIFPTAIVGAEEAHPLLGRSSLLGKLFGVPSVPLTPTFPWLGAVGLLPMPVKWRVVIGEPIDLSAYGPKAADDALVVHRLNEQIRGILQGLVDTARLQRGGAFSG
jgi:1-acyl-sn-glycerol-3-phosphate acyltransferase